jgi:hypothetical protein
VGTPADAQEFAKERSWNVAKTEAPPGEQPASESDAKKGCKSGQQRCTGENAPIESNGLGGQDGAARSAARLAALPYHMSEQLNPPSIHRGGKRQRVARVRVVLEIQGLCMRWGVNRIGFLTFTFADEVKTIEEAQRRFNSINSNALAGR